MPAIIIPGRAARGQRPSTLTLNPRNHYAIRAVWPLGVYRGQSLLPVNAAPTIAGDVKPIGLNAGGTGSYFDGSGDYIDVGAPTQTEIYDDFSVTCWIRTTASGSQFAVAKDTNTGNRGWVLGVSGSNQLYWELGGGSFAGDQGPTINDGADHLIGFTLVGTVMYGFVDGRQVSTALGMDISANSGATINIGRRHYPGFETPFTGTIYDVCVHGRPLTHADHWARYDPATRWGHYWVPGRRVFFDVGAAPTFQAAWARGANVILQPGIR